jgi:hypothetical protein
MRTAIIIALLLVAVAAPLPTHACTCVCQNRVDDQKEMFQEASAVFVGEVLEIRDSTPEEQLHHSEESVARMRVERFWKGVKTKEILISAMGIKYGGCCDVLLKKGEKYLIYAVGEEMSTGCTRTKLVEQAKEDLKALGPGKTFAK